MKMDKKIQQFSVRYFWVGIRENPRQMTNGEES